MDQQQKQKPYNGEERRKVLHEEDYTGDERRQSDQQAQSQEQPQAQEPNQDTDQR